MSKLNDQKDLLEQLEKLRLEKELLEKHVFMLNDCLSVDELKTKIADLEKKKEMLISIEDVIGRLRTEIEPLNYLKSILENKLLAEDRSNKIDNFQFGMNFLKTSAGGKYSQTSNTQSIPTNSIKTNSVSSQKLNFKSLETIEMPKSNTGSIVNDGSLDECMQLLDQYDIVTEQDMLYFSEQKRLKSPSVNQEPTTSFMNDIDNKIQDDQIVTTSSVDVEGIAQFRNEENNSSIKKSAGSSLDNSVTRDIAYSENYSGQFCEASTSQLLENKDKSNSPFDEYLLETSFLGNDIHKRIFSTEEHDSKKSIINDYRDSTQKRDKIASKSDNKSNAGDLSTLFQQLLKNPITQSDSVKVEDKLNESVTCDSTIVSSNMEEHINEMPNKEIDLIALQNVTSNLINEPAGAESNLQNSYNANNSEIVINSFNDMNLNIEVLRGIYSLGFVTPTFLQQRVIMHCLRGYDVIVYSGPNYGRTMTFTIPLLQRINTNLNECQALILVPNRDLAVHIQKIIMNVGDFLDVNICIGGDNVPKKLSVVPHVIVGTPAGITSMIECKSLLTRCIHTVVVNKVDMMLTYNYTKLITEILNKLDKTKQVTVLTSGKLDCVLDVYMDLLRDPVVIINSKSIEDENKTLPTSLPKQFYLNIPEDWKLNVLSEVYETLKMQRAIVFCNTFDRAITVYQLLQKVSYSVLLFNIEMNTYEHQKKLDMFSSDSHLQMIITTDPVEGYQFQHADWIVNYDLPVNPTFYQNRIAKCDENIRVLNFINENDIHIKSNIEKHNKTHMIKMPQNMIDVFQY